MTIIDLYNLIDDNNNESILAIADCLEDTK